MTKKILTIITLFSLTVTLAAQSAELSGDLETFYAVGAPWTDSDTSAGRFIIGDTSFTASLDANYDNSSAYAEASINYDAITNTADWSVSELWIDYTSSFWGIRIGRQKSAWGKADGIDITNVLCPSDMSSFIAMTSDDSKLPIDAIRLSFSGSQFTADAYWIPFFTPAALPEETLNVMPLTVPETKLSNGEYGLKLSGYFSAFDVSLYGFYGWEDIPEYKRMTMVGADAAIPIKEVVLRVETAFFPQRYFIADEQRNELSALIGLDWMPSGWTLTAQYFCDYVFGDLDSPLLAYVRPDAYTHGATLSVSKSLLNETLELSLNGIINFNDFDSLINPSVNYSLSDQINLSAGSYIILPGPDNDGKYGQYKDYSAFYLKAKYSF